jgi:hypothetical protein
LQEVAAHEWESAVRRLQIGEAAEPAAGGPASDEARRIEAAFAAYFEARGRFRIDPEGRSTKHTHWTEDRDTDEWTVAQMLIDLEGRNDWEAKFAVLLAPSRAENRAVVRFDATRPVGAI